MDGCCEEGNTAARPACDYCYRFLMIAFTQKQQQQHLLRLFVLSLLNFSEK